MTKAKLEFDLSDEESKSEFNYAIKGKNYAIILFNLRNKFTKIANDKHYHVEQLNEKLQDKLNNLNLNHKDIYEITQIFNNVKDHICDEFFDELNEINLNDNIM